MEEQIKEVESIENVDEVSPQELEEVDKTLQEKQPSASEQAIVKAKVAQSGIRTLAEVIHDLSQPLPIRHTKKLTKGPASGATYIPWPIVGKYLDFYAPGWESEIQVVTDEYGAHVTTHITIPTSDFGKVRRGDVGFEPHVTNKGTEKEKLTGFGGSSPIAARMSLKRSASQFGLGKYLYEK